MTLSRGYKFERAIHVKAMIEAGESLPAIAAEIKRSVATVQNIILDFEIGITPDLVKRLPRINRVREMAAAGYYLEDIAQDSRVKCSRQSVCAIIAKHNIRRNNRIRIQTPRSIAAAQRRGSKAQYLNRKWAIRYCKIRRIADRGYSAAQARRWLPLSRNAVLGFANRNNIKFRGNQRNQYTGLATQTEESSSCRTA